MADFSFSDLFSGAIDWAKANPGLTGAMVGGIGTLLDPAKPATETRIQDVRLPEYIAPYVGRMLQRGEALSNEQYMPYSAPRIADFSADQQQAFQNIRNLQPLTPMQTQGGGIVGEAANRLLQGSGQRFDQDMADFYMSPYMQSVTDIQKREAQRDFDKAMPGLNAAAQRASAFGGDRHAIVEAEARRNLAQQLGDIQAQGLQGAFTNAQGQFNADQNRMMTGATGAASAGNTLAGIGQQGFQNQLATNSGLLGIGQQQQALEQKSLDTGYQDFMAQRQHPYDQFKFMQGAIQGLPVTQTATAQTASAPTMTQQLMSNIAAGYGLGAYRP